MHRLMRKFIILTIAMLAGIGAWAQSWSFTVPTEESQKMLDSVKYVVPDFVTGTIVFDNGEQYVGPINIYTLSQNIHYKNEDGQVMELTNNMDVSSVYIKGRTYLNSRFGYLEVLEAYGDIFMGEVKSVNLIAQAKEGAMGTTSMTTSIQTIDVIDGRHGGILDITPDKKIPYSYKKIPYVYKKGSFQKATKKFFLKNFGDKKGFIENYLQNNDVDFNNVDDVRKLFKAVIK